MSTEEFVRREKVWNELMDKVNDKYPGQKIVSKDSLCLEYVIAYFRKLEVQPSDFPSTSREYAEETPLKLSREELKPFIEWLDELLDMRNELAASERVGG